MKLYDMRLGDLLSQIGQSKPTLSGSTASLIAGRLGVAMIRMALAVSSKHGPDNDLILERLDSVSARLLEAAEQDRAAALSFIEALRDGTDLVDRRRAITGATLEPLAAAHVLIELLEHAVDAVSAVEPSVASDFFGGVELISGSFAGVMMAVESNLKQDAAEDLTGRTLDDRVNLRARHDDAMAALRVRGRVAGLQSVLRQATELSNSISSDPVIVVAPGACHWTPLCDQLGRSNLFDRHIYCFEISILMCARCVSRLGIVSLAKPISA